jgi:hypothetical protein
VTPQGLKVIEIVEGLSFDDLQKVTAAPLLN